MTIPELYRLYTQYPSVQTDTRKLQQGDIFFALRGDNFNGNAFALKALESGAAYSVIDEYIDASNDKLIKVDNVLETLQQLAKFHREQFTIPFIAITGSNGKTTTKELVHVVLSSNYITCRAAVVIYIGIGPAQPEPSHVPFLPALQKCQE